ncbi:MAG: VWA domain-containing protein [Candidatus Kapabacteria bacterium]|nr:VWA domain-containing protein [Candidatus Kapabacteria bacterium]
MNSYSFSFGASWILLVLLLIIALGITLYTYKNTVPEIAQSKKNLLIILRTIAIGLLLFIIFDPVLTMIGGSTEPPRLAVLIDNSLSCATNDAAGSRKEELFKAIKGSDFISLDQKNTKICFFDYELKFPTKFSIDSFSQNGQMTDISKAIRWARNNSEEDNIRSILLISDGAFNSGINPVYEADEFAKPIYVIGIGDTNDPKDLSIQSLVTNEVIYLENQVPVNVNFKISGYEKAEVAIDLLDNGNKIAEQKVNISPEMQDYSVIFNYMPKQDGIHKISAKANELSGELTTKNNQISEFVNVLKNKRKIVILAGAPSADLSFFRSTVSKEKGVEVKVFIQKKEAEFYDPAPTIQDFKETDVFALIGFPISSTSANVLQMLKTELNAGKSLIFIPSISTDYSKLNPLENYLPFSVVSSNPQEMLAQADVKPQATVNHILRINGNDDDAKLWNQLPPLFHTETFVRPKPESEILASMKVNGVSLKEPLIIMRDFQDKKSLAIMGYGLYRWKLFGYALEKSKGKEETTDLFATLLQNSVQWLSVTDKNKNVKIKTGKLHYSSNEKIDFYAQVYDAAYTPIENAYVSLKINGGKEQREIALNSIGNGRYTAAIDPLPEGDYAFSGYAKVNEKDIGNDNGRFSVGELPLEYQNLKMNVQLLRSIAERSGGKFYLAKDASMFLKDLKANSNFSERGVTKRNEIVFRSFSIILIIVIILFSLEWFLRKKFGMI